MFLLFAVLYLPVLLFKRKIHAGFFMRLGFLPSLPELDRPVWIHAVSLGEAISIRHLVEILKEKFPQKDFVISTVTPTGNKIVRSIAGKNDVVMYLPLDLSWVVRRVISKINPSVFVIVETEIWPNLISCLYRKNIPIVVVNTRISQRSFKGYSLAKFLICPLLNKISAFCVQSESDAGRLLKLGVLPEKIKQIGNMKFDIRVRDYEALKKDYTDYRLNFGLATNARLWVSASTHLGEEEEILRIYINLSRDFPELKLLIAPRHPERSGSVEKLVNKYSGLKAYRISRLARLDGIALDSTHKPVFILDTVGQLMYFYAISDIVFVGGSLVKTGGHNILEPASLGKPVLFGQYMFNFRDISEMFLNNKAGLMVRNGRELEDNLKNLLGNQDEILRLSSASREIILKNQGATARNAQEISVFLEKLNCGKI